MQKIVKCSRSNLARGFTLVELMLCLFGIGVIGGGIALLGTVIYFLLSHAG